MKQIIAATAISLFTAVPAIAQEAEPKDVDQGFSLIEEGAKLLLRGLMTEMEPAIEDLKGLTDEMRAAMAEFGETMGPALIALMGRVDDMRNYDAPAFLPNGDIIIRRSPDAPPYTPDPVDTPDLKRGEIEL